MFLQLAAAQQQSSPRTGLLLVLRSTSYLGELMKSNLWNKYIIDSGKLLVIEHAKSNLERNVKDESEILN